MPVTGWDAVRTNHELFRIDLNSVRDDNRVVTLMGFSRPQLVPDPGDRAIAIDEDGAYYDAVVEAVLPDSRVYLRLKWASKRAGVSVPPLSYGFDHRVSQV